MRCYLMCVQGSIDATYIYFKTTSSINKKPYCSKPTSLISVISYWHTKTTDWLSYFQGVNIEPELDLIYLQEIQTVEAACPTLYCSWPCLPECYADTILYTHTHTHHILIWPFCCITKFQTNSWTSDNFPSKGVKRVFISLM